MSLRDIPFTDAEYEATLAVYLVETQRLLDQMQAEQAEIDQWKCRSRLREGEIDSA